MLKKKIRNNGKMKGVKVNRYEEISKRVERKYEEKG